MSLVYICGPLTYGGTVLRADAIAHRVETAELVAAALMRQGHAPVLSHGICRHQEAIDAIPQEQAISVCLQMLEACEAVAYIDGWEDSAGCRAEREHAMDIGLLTCDPAGFFHPEKVWTWTREKALAILKGEA